MMVDAPTVGGASPPAEDLPGSTDRDTADRVERLLEVVQQFAILDFSQTAPVGSVGDDLDALAAGINMLGEELSGWHQDFHQRVTQRTVELNASVRELRRFNEQTLQLAKMSNLLQVASDRDEAFRVLGRFAPRIFPDTSGAIYTYPLPSGHVEAIAAWGPRQGGFPLAVDTETCRALRQGPSHEDHERDTGCEHLVPHVPGHSLCVPITLRGVGIGLLSLHGNSDSSEQADGADAPIPADFAANERLALAASEQFGLAVTNLELRNELQAQAIRDPVTGLYNRRHLEEVLTRELRRAGRANTPVSVLMIDLDHFKQLNDTYGHSAGDAVLAEFAALLRDSTRSEDIACRYGGEEFTVIMAGLYQAEAGERAEQIRTTIALHDFTWNEQTLHGLTASIGVASSPDHAHTTDELLNAADTAMYRAKRRGRNRVHVGT